MPSSFDCAYEECVRLVQAGHNIQECLSLFPEHATELLPLLEAITATRRATNQAAMPLAARSRVKKRVLAAWNRKRAASSNLSPFKIHRSA